MRPKLPSNGRNYVPKFFLLYLWNGNWNYELWSHKQYIYLLFSRTFLLFYFGDHPISWYQQKIMTHKQAIMTCLWISNWLTFESASECQKSYSKRNIIIIKRNINFSICSRYVGTLLMSICRFLWPMIFMYDSTVIQVLARLISFQFVNRKHPQLPAMLMRDEKVPFQWAKIKKFLSLCFAVEKNYSGSTLQISAIILYW